MIRQLLVTRSCVTSVSCVSAGSRGAAGTSLSCGASTRGVVSEGSTEDVSTAGKNNGRSLRAFCFIGVVHGDSGPDTSEG